MCHGSFRGLGEAFAAFEAFLTAMEIACLRSDFTSGNFATAVFCRCLL